MKVSKRKVEEKQRAKQKVVEETEALLRAEEEDALRAATEAAKLAAGRALQQAELAAAEVRTVRCNCKS